MIPKATRLLGLSRSNAIKAVLLTAIGLSGSLGALLDWQWLRLAGHFTAAAPMPLVFDRYRGLDHWALQGALDLVLENGHHFPLPIDYGLFARIRGPHIRKIAYVIPSSYAPVISREQVFHALRIGLCGQGELAEDLGLPAPVREIRLSLRSSSVASELTWQDTTTCD